MILCPIFAVVYPVKIGRKPTGPQYIRWNTKTGDWQMKKVFVHPFLKGKKSLNSPSILFGRTSFRHASTRLVSLSEIFGTLPFRPLAVPPTFRVRTPFKSWATFNDFQKRPVRHLKAPPNIKPNFILSGRLLGSAGQVEDQ